MSRLKRLKSINGLSKVLESIATNQCSLSENDVNLLNAANAKLNKLKTKKGLTDKHYQIEVSDIVDLINQFLTN
ncbi:MAG: hypothetical protein IR153_00020 [Flavobacterium sp.]|nr:hypothetical protein [Flavobacterium sp.]